MAQGQCIPTTYVLTPVSLNHFLLQLKSLDISCVVSYFYDTEFKILVGLGWAGLAGSTENFCNFAEATYF